MNSDTRAGPGRAEFLSRWGPSRRMRSSLDSDLNSFSDGKDVPWSPVVTAVLVPQPAHNGIKLTGVRVAGFRTHSHPAGATGSDDEPRLGGGLSQGAGPPASDQRTGSFPLFAKGVDSAEGFGSPGGLHQRNSEAYGVICSFVVVVCVAEVRERSAITLRCLELGKNVLLIAGEPPGAASGLTRCARPFAHHVDFTLKCYVSGSKGLSCLVSSLINTWSSSRSLMWQQEAP